MAFGGGGEEGVRGGGERERGGGGGEGERREVTFKVLVRLGAGEVVEMEVGSGKEEEEELVEMEAGGGGGEVGERVGGGEGGGREVGAGGGEEGVEMEVGAGGGEEGGEGGGLVGMREKEEETALDIAEMMFVLWTPGLIPLPLCRPGPSPVLPINIPVQTPTSRRPCGRLATPPHPPSPPWSARRWIC